MRSRTAINLPPEASAPSGMLPHVPRPVPRLLAAARRRLPGPRHRAWPCCSPPTSAPTATPRWSTGSRSAAACRSSSPTSRSALVFLPSRPPGGLRPGIGTVVQIVVVGPRRRPAVAPCSTPRTASSGRRCCWQQHSRCWPSASRAISAPSSAPDRRRPPALAWDPPVPFNWSYSAVQAPRRAGRLAARRHHRPRHRGGVLLLGPAVDLTSRMLRLDVHQKMDP